MTHSGPNAAFPYPPDGYEGMTMREWYAGMAMQGLLAGPEDTEDPREVAARAIAMADSMLRAMKVTP